jgi:hypothetical protein
MCGDIHQQDISYDYCFLLVHLRRFRGQEDFFYNTNQLRVVLIFKFRYHRSAVRFREMFLFRIGIACFEHIRSHAGDKYIPANTLEIQNNQKEIQNNQKI